jgi:hypothetical protein
MRSFVNRFGTHRFARFAVVAAFASAPGCTCRQSVSDASDASEDKAAAPAAIITVSATDLLREYDADRARADIKYKGQRLRVSGAVAGVEKDASSGEPYVVFGGDADARASAVRCYFADARYAAALAKGVSLTIDCVADGLGSSTAAVVVRKCALGGSTVTMPPAASDGAPDGKSALDVCRALESDGVAAKCRAGSGTGDTARFDLPSLAGKTGMVVRLPDDGSFAKYAAGVASQPPTSPLLPYYASPRARVVVHLTPGLSPDVATKTKALVEKL